MELLEGESLRDRLDRITMHITMAPTPPRSIEPRVPDWLDSLILRLLAKDPAERHDDMASVSSELERMDDPIGSGAVADIDDDGLSDLVVTVPDQGLVRAYLSVLEPLTSSP